jgi:hypothetical protein
MNLWRRHQLIVSQNDVNRQQLNRIVAKLEAADQAQAAGAGREQRRRVCHRTPAGARHGDTRARRDPLCDLTGTATPRIVRVVDKNGPRLRAQDTGQDARNRLWLAPLSAFHRL